MSKKVDDYIALLGHKATDKVTGFKGVVTSVSFDLYGCIQIVLSPAVKPDGTKGEGFWFDVNRLNLTSKNPVMDVPSFIKGPVAEGKKGPAFKPLP